MSVEKSLVKQEIKKTGFWKFSDLYTFCFDAFRDEGYKLIEKKYTEKIKTEGKEIIIEWECKKKISDYFRYVVKLDWHILGMKDAEVERDGKRESTNKGEVKIKFDAILERDYEDNWDKKPFWKFMRGIYDKYVIRTTIDEYEKELFKDAMSIIKDVKSFLELSSN